MRAVRSLLEASPTLRKAFCKARIALGVRAAGAYTALGAIRIGEGQYQAAARAFWQAIQLDPAVDDPYLGIVEVMSLWPEILDSAWGSSAKDQAPPGFNTHRNWNELSFGFGRNVAETCRCLDRAIQKDPLNLQLYHLANRLFGVGEFKAGVRYIHRMVEAQRQLAQARGIDRSDVRYLRDAWTYNIGHTQFMDWYLKLGLLGWRPQRKTVVLAPAKQIANKVYLDYYRPYLHDVITETERIQQLTPEAECLEEYLYTTEMRGEQTASIIAQVRVQQQWEAEGRPPLLSLRPADAERGHARLRELGVPADAWYVGLHVREPGFHGDFDQRHRNANIAHCDQAIRSITARGGWVIRMGNPTMTRLPAQPQVIDYAHSPLRCDWMDIFLCASMRFMVGTASGLTHVPYTFGTPTLSLNWTFACMPPWHGKDLFITKRFWSKPLNRHLTLKEILTTGAGFVQTDRFFAFKGIEPIENTPDEINDAVLEMMDWLDNGPTTPENAQQQRWKAIGEPHGVVCLSRVAASFLRRHPFLLD